MRSTHAPHTHNIVIPPLRMFLKMVDRGKAMLRFITDECPDDRGDVLTLFTRKYPELGLRAITKTVAKKMGMYVQPHARTPQNHTHTLTHTLTHTRYQRCRYVHALAQALHAHWMFPTRPSWSLHVRFFVEARRSQG